jgi:DNA-binding NtrC family response regulator
LGDKTLTPQAMRVLQGYPWPGNVRELANTIERLLILSPGPTIDVDDLPNPSRRASREPRPVDFAGTVSNNRGTVPSRRRPA